MFFSFYNPFSSPPLLPPLLPRLPFPPSLSLSPPSPLSPPPLPLPPALPPIPGTWESITNELGAFTPCFIDIVILGTAYVAMLVLALARLLVLVSRQPLDPGPSGSLGKAVASFVSLACAIVPLMQLSARVSLSSFSSDQDLPPSEVR